MRFCYFLLPLLLGVTSVVHAQSIPSSVTIAAILPLTGNAASIGDLIRSGLILGVEECNKKNAASGPKFHLVIEDTQSDKTKAVSAYRRLIDVDKVKVVITASSGHALALKPLAERDRTLLFADVTHPEATRNSDFILRHSNVIEFDARVMAEAIKNRGIATAAIVFQEDDFGLAYANALSRRLAEDKIDAIALGYSVEDENVRPVLLKAQAADGVVIVAVGSKAGLIPRQLREVAFQWKAFRRMSAGRR